MIENEIINQIAKLKKEYSALIEKRIEELDTPEVNKIQSTEYFMRVERGLCDEISELKLKIGINDRFGVGALCCECLEIFSMPKGNFSRRRGTEFMTMFNWCLDHKGRTPVKFKDGVVENRTALGLYLSSEAV